MLRPGDPLETARLALRPFVAADLQERYAIPVPEDVWRARAKGGGRRLPGGRVSGGRPG